MCCNLIAKFQNINRYTVFFNVNESKIFVYIPDDFFIYDEANMLIYGKETGITYQLGQKVKIVVVDVDKRMRTIDFEICT